VNIVFGAQIASVKAQFNGVSPPKFASGVPPALWYENTTIFKY